MIQIRPVSDLRNKYPEIENIVANGNPVYLTKNGYGTMVVLSLEAYGQYILGKPANGLGNRAIYQPAAS